MKITRKDRLEIKKIISKFSKIKSKEKIFYNLCFALTAPQCKFENNIKVIEELQRLDFYNMPLPCERCDPKATGAEALYYMWYKYELPELCKPVRF